MLQKSLLTAIFSITLLSGFISVSFADIQSSYQQMKSGAALEDILCKQNKILVLRDNGNPVCLNEKTVQKMVDRFGWVIVNVSQSENLREDSVKEKALITDNNTQETTTSVESGSENTIMLSDPRITDTSGNTSEKITVSQQVQITADITNDRSTPTEFVYVATVTDENNNLVSDQWLSAKLEPHQIFTGALSWIPEKHGKYTVSIGTSEDVIGKNLSDELILIVTVSQDGNKNMEKIIPSKSIPRSMEIFYDDNNSEIKRHYVNNTDTTIGYFIHSYNEFENKIEEEKYDKFGNKIEEKKYNKDGELYDFSQWEYDARGNEIKSQMFPVDFMISSMTIISEYDAQNNKIKETSLQNDEVIGIIMWGYDKNNDLTDEKIFDREENLREWKKYIYDQSNNLTDEKIFDREENLREWKKYIYDQSNNLTDEKIFDREENLREWKKYIYDDDDNLTGTKDMLPV